MFKVNNKDIGTFIVNFEQVNAGWEHANKNIHENWHNKI